MSTVNLVMPANYSNLSLIEQEFTEGGATKTYYNRAGTLSNTCNLIANGWMLGSIAVASKASGVYAPGIIITAFIAQNNGNKMFGAKSLCDRYSSGAYITLTIKSNLTGWITSVSTRKGR